MKFHLPFVLRGLLLLVGSLWAAAASSVHQPLLGSHNAPVETNTNRGLTGFQQQDCLDLEGDTEFFNTLQEDRCRLTVDRTVCIQRAINTGGYLELEENATGCEQARYYYCPRLLPCYENCIEIKLMHFCEALNAFFTVEDACEMDCDSFVATTATTGDDEEETDASRANAVKASGRSIVGFAAACFLWFVM